MKHRLIIAFFGILLISACCRSVLLTHQPLEIQAEGYPDHDLDTLLISKYEYGSNFNNLVLTDTLLGEDISSFRNGHTKVLNVDFDSDFEWKIILPATGQAITLKDFIYGPGTREVCQLIYLGGQRQNNYSPMISAVINNVDSLFSNESPLLTFHK